MFFSSALAMHVKPCLDKLTQDVDHDVQHFASEALESKYQEFCFFFFFTLIDFNIEVIEAL